MPSFISPDLWPANSYDLYYKIIQQQVRQSWLYNINDLKPQLLQLWSGVDDTIIYYGALTRGICVFKLYAGKCWTPCCDIIYIYSAVCHEKLHFLSNV